MIYADFSYYKDTFCGEMAEGDFKRLSRQASAYLDSVTFDRIAAVTDEKIKERVKEACCAVADAILLNENGVVSQESNDGVSVIYTRGVSNTLTDEEPALSGGGAVSRQYGAVVSGGGVMLGVYGNDYAYPAAV